MMRRLLLVVPLLLGLLAAPVLAQDPPPVPQTFDWWEAGGIPMTTPWGQEVDTASTRMIRSWTTMPEYTNPLVDHLPAHPSAVSPTAHFGDPIGKPGLLHEVEEIYGYFEALAGSTDRVRFQRLGKTEEGRDLALVQVGSTANLARLEEIKAGLNALADPRGTSADEADRIVADIPAVYTFYAGLHSPETGPPEMVMEMAYRLAASDDPKIRTIRDSVVVFIVPVAEPDGRDRVVQWHRRHNADVYDYEDRVPGPPYWGKYIFHDNNRDGLQLSARLTQELKDLFLEWKYPVGHDLHESVPYLYVSTGTGPYNPTVDAITVSEWQWMSNNEVTALTARGMPGVWTHNFYTGWYPGYLLWLTNTRNAVGRFYETFGNSVPNTMARELGERSTSVEWYRPNPPRDSTIWSLRNNTNYMQTGALEALSLVARDRARILDNYWRKAGNSLRKGRTEAPYAYVVPADQPRKSDASYMVNLLMRQGIEVHRATEEGTFGEGDGVVAVREGDYVVRMDQPYRNFVLTLMEKQEFPEDAPAPYDDVAWTYPLMFNVTARAVDQKAIQEQLEMEVVTGAVAIPGRYTRQTGGDDAWHAVLHHGSAGAMEARLALGDAPVRAAEEAFEVDDDRELPPGTWLVRKSDLSEDGARNLAREHGVEVLTVEADRLDDVPTHELDLPRIALLHTWSRTQAEGWTRYALDQSGVEYEYVGEDRLADLRPLRDRFDVVLFPHQGTGNNARRILQGLDPEDGPLAYTRTEEFPAHGFPDASEDITGGMGLEGLLALREFLEDGGTLVATGSAATLPVELGFVREAGIGEAGGMFIPGSILQGKVTRSESPLVYGFGDEVPLFHQWGPYLQLDDDARELAPLTYADEGELLLSGIARNANGLKGDPAAYAAPLGEGWVVLFAFDVFHRYQSHGNFALVWNALMNWNDLGAGREDGQAPATVAPEPDEPSEVDRARQGGA